MGLGWQQGPLGATQGRFLTAQTLPDRLLFAEPLQRRMRVKVADQWIADSENIILLHEPGKYPVAYFPSESIQDGVLTPAGNRTTHPELGETLWFRACVHGQSIPSAAWTHVALPGHASVLHERVAFAWQAMDGFYEEDERIVGHASDPYHRIDIRQSSRHLVVRILGRIIADTHRPRVLYESGYAPRWYIPLNDVDRSALALVEKQSFCPYKGVASYFDIGEVRHAAWSYKKAWAEVERISDFISFEPDKVDVFIDGNLLAPKDATTVPLYGPDRRLDLVELIDRSAQVTRKN